MPSSSGKVEPESSMIDQIAQVLQLVQKEAPLSKKQARHYCSHCLLRRYSPAYKKKKKFAATVETVIVTCICCEDFAKKFVSSQVQGQASFCWFFLKMCRSQCSGLLAF